MLIFQRKSKWLWVQLGLMAISFVLYWCFFFYPTSGNDLVIVEFMDKLNVPLRGNIVESFYHHASQIYEGDRVSAMMYIFFVLGFMLHPFIFLISNFLVCTRFVLFRRLFASLNTMSLVINVTALLAYLPGRQYPFILYVISLGLITIALWLPVYKEKVDVDAIIAEASAC